MRLLRRASFPMLPILRIIILADDTVEEREMLSDDLFLMRNKLRPFGFAPATDALVAVVRCVSAKLTSLPMAWTLIKGASGFGEVPCEGPRDGPGTSPRTGEGCDTDGVFWCDFSLRNRAIIDLRSFSTTGWIRGVACDKGDGRGGGEVVAVFAFAPAGSEGANGAARLPDFTVEVVGVVVSREALAGEEVRGGIAAG